MQLLVYRHLIILKRGIVLKKNSFTLSKHYFAGMKLPLLLVVTGLFFSHDVLLAQPGTDIDVKKPEQYESRTLASEKTGSKKFTFPRKLYQNTVTHYNYYFNAANRLNEIEERARQQQLQQEDYTQLLPFFDFSTDATSGDSELDSVIYKCNAGILLHDLRNSWVDDLYFLLGKAYYLRKDYDSANMVFRYINYAFAPKDDGYDIPIGSNASNEEHIFSIATKEKKGLKKITSKPPRRNEDLLWMARTYTASNKPFNALGLLQILKTDPYFPERLHGELNQNLAYAYFQMGSYDSAGVFLQKAEISGENTRQKARREYLAAQLLQKAGMCEEASKSFVKAAEHAVDPLMEIYARLNVLSCAGDSSSTGAERVRSLLSLAHREKFVNYRGLIYYTTALEEIKMGDNATAISYLGKSIDNSSQNPDQKSRSYYLLGNLAYDENQFADARFAYDSVQLSSITKQEEQDTFNKRLEALRKITDNFKLVHHQDSLQALARLPEKERTEFIRKAVRQKLKEQGLKESEGDPFMNPAVQTNDNGFPTSPDLSNQNPLSSRLNMGGGEWYFNNDALIAAGYNSFNSKWGNRPNIDNWNRSSEIKKAAFDLENNATDDSPEEGKNADAQNQDPDSEKNDNTEDDTEVAEPESNEVSYDAFLARVPLTEEKLKVSNGKIAKAFFTNAEVFEKDLENYPAALSMYDSLAKRSPGSKYDEEALFNRYYCNKKIGRNYSADSAKAVLNTKYQDGKLAARLSAANTGVKSSAASDKATKDYEKIYDLFIEGKFDDAQQAKKTADSIHGESYWTPQLLFIESVYFISERQDSIAIDKLTNIQQRAAGTPFAEKAERMIDVLNRREEIESYLTQLQIERYKDDEPAPVINLTPVQTTIEKKEAKPAKDSVISKPAIITYQAKAIADTAKTEIKTIVRSFTYNPLDGQYAAIIMDNVAPVYINESKNAFNRYNQATFYNQKINAIIQKIDDRYSLVLMGPFKDAADAAIYVDKVKPQASGRIIPWLKSDKYGFIIISQYNLDLLSETKDMDGYRSLLNEALPGKF